MRLKIKFRAYNSGGPGGQHGNRSMNAIEASVELPDGTLLKASSALKSQKNNRNLAAMRLRQKVQEHFKTDEVRFRAPETRVRTYHVPRNVVTDHASGDTLSWKESQKDISPLVEARARAIHGTSDS